MGTDGNGGTKESSDRERERDRRGTLSSDKDRERERARRDHDRPTLRDGDAPSSRRPSCDDRRGTGTSRASTRDAAPTVCPRRRRQHPLPEEKSSAMTLKMDGGCGLRSNFEGGLGYWVGFFRERERGVGWVLGISEFFFFFEIQNGAVSVTLKKQFATNIIVILSSTK
ncbi:hypothetical protein AAHE18_20G181700 [Arachis hypogaea]